MGLHLNYELRLSGSTSQDEVLSTLTSLRDAALALPFKQVSAIYRAPFVETGSADPALSALRLYAAIIGELGSDDDALLTGDPATAAGFVIRPGDRCEPATVGFLLRADSQGERQDWFWHCSCKTQYASIVGDQHLVTCHGGLVRLLDHVIGVGVSVVVRDETGYWETRDEARLIAEVRAMNQVVARIAGSLGDAIGPSVGAPVFEHPEFERLEMGE